MGNRCRHLSHRRHPSCPREVGLCLLQRRLRQFPLGDDLSQLLVDAGKLPGPFNDPLLELLIQFCDFFLGLP